MWLCLKKHAYGIFTSEPQVQHHEHQSNTHIYTSRGSCYLWERPEFTQERKKNSAIVAESSWKCSLYSVVLSNVNIHTELCFRFFFFIHFIVRRVNHGCPLQCFFFSIALIILKNQSHKSFYIYHILHALHSLYGLCLGGFERVLRAPCWERLPEQLPSVRRNPINIHQPQGRCGKKKVDPHWSETANFPFFFRTCGKQVLLLLFWEGQTTNGRL